MSWFPSVLHINLFRRDILTAKAKNFALQNYTGRLGRVSLPFLQVKRQPGLDIASESQPIFLAQEHYGVPNMKVLAVGELDF